jgi:hypothetical protein
MVLDLKVFRKQDFKYEIFDKVYSDKGNATGWQIWFNDYEGYCKILKLFSNASLLIF